MSTSDPITAVTATLTDVIADLQQYRYDTSAAITRLQNENTALKIELEALKNPPIKDKTAVISRTTLRYVRGVTITKDDTPSSTQDEMTRQLLKLCASMGFSHWRGLLNVEEVKAHLAFSEDDTRNLPAYGRKQGLGFIADSLDSQAKRVTDGKLSVTSYEAYIKGLKTLGTRALYYNDADANEKVPYLQSWIQITRNAMAAAQFDVPVIGSFMGNFDRSKYPGFDFYEIQCFGTPAELKSYLARPDVDIFCLDGQSSVSVSQLTVNEQIELDARMNNFFFYTAFDYDGTDWRKMAAQIAVIKDFIAKWKAQ